MTDEDKYKEVMDAVLTRRLVSVVARLADVAEFSLMEIAFQSGAKASDFSIVEMEAKLLTPAERMQTILLAWAILKSTPPGVDST